MTEPDIRTGNVGRKLPFALLWIAVLACGLLPTPRAIGQEFIDRANALYDDIVEARRSESIILPALMDLAGPPLGVDTPDKAQLVFYGGEVWPTVEKWLGAPSQKAMLEALRKGTRGDKYDTAMALAQRYGADVDPSYIRGRMYTDLGDPPLLSAAKHLYMERFDDLRCLVHVEATRLAGEGKPIDAMNLLLSLAQFGYQMADREFLHESRWGYLAMADAISRVRDIAYVDFQGDRIIDPEQLHGVIDRLDPQNGPLRLDRLNFPRANQIAADQLIQALYIPKGGVNKDRYVPTMVRIATTDRPLRRFSAASVFEADLGRQKDWFDIEDVLADVFKSWDKAWLLDPQDPVLALPFAWQTDIVSDQTRVVRVGVGGDMGELFRLRTLVELERVATRQSLGLLGRFYVTGIFATAIDGIRPRWVPELEADPLNPDRGRGRKPPLVYFRPVTDYYVADKRETPKPHTMEVFPGDGTNFEVTLHEDQFLLYSVGKNGVDDRGTRMSRDPESLVGDYLVWPPMLSLHRTHLRQIGDLK